MSRVVVRSGARRQVLRPIVHGSARLLNRTEESTCSGGQAFLGAEGEGREREGFTEQVG